jgi:hypothetical protein
MRDTTEIQNKIHTLLLGELDRRVAEATQRLPRRCQHNHRQVLDSRKDVAGEANEGFNRLDRTRLPLVRDIGLCLLGSEDPTEWNGDICDEPADAQRCPHFTPLQDKAAILAQFEADLESEGWLDENMPAVASLLWVLDTTAPNYHLPWWKRLWYRLLRLRVEPVRAPAGLLTAGGDDGVHGS